MQHLNTVWTPAPEGPVLHKIGAMLEELSHLVHEVSSAPAPEPVSAEVPATDYRAAVKRVMKSRDARAKHFPADWFSNPAWDLLLFLYDAHLNDTDLTVGDVGYGTGTRPTTTIRWLEILEKDQLVDRRRCNIDTRRVYISLNQKGAQLMQNYFESIARFG